MLLILDMNDPRPLHDQVASAIRRAIAAGDVRPGERLPPARDLAASLGINVNTVLRALRGLRDQGLLEFRRGRGVSVLRRPDARAVLSGRIREVLDEAARFGYGPHDVIELVEECSSGGSGTPTAAGAERGRTPRAGS